MEYYIYVWYIKDTKEVFYVGRGHGDRFKTLKKRSKYFYKYYDNYECESAIIMGNLTYDESIEAEIEIIEYFKVIGMAKANIHNGGKFGGDVVSNMPKKDKEAFIEKMTEINRNRCGTEEFRSHISECTRKRYEDPNERIKHSAIIRKTWSNEKLRAEQAERTRKYASEHPEMVKARSEKMQKPCVLEFNGEMKKFDSYKELKNYLKERYDFQITRRKEQEMLHHKIPYETTWAKYKMFEGLKMYYVS